MEEDGRTCLICLDPPLKESPLFLLACGCKCGWFHESCEREWLERVPLYDYYHNGTPPCPACKRVPRMTTNFSFAYTAGPAQEYAWQTLWIFCGEIGLTVSLFAMGGRWAVCLPLQSYLTLLLPFLIPSRRDVLFFIQRLRYKYMLFLSYVFLRFVVHHQLLHTNAKESSLHLAWIGNMYFFCLLLASLNQWQEMPRGQRMHPFASFAISREMKHAGTLFAEPVPGTTKGLKA